MKVARKDILTAIANTPRKLDNLDIRSVNSVCLGFYTPKDANWSWELHAILINNAPLVVASRFGFIVAECN